jgi:hypothetical protein
MTTNRLVTSGRMEPTVREGDIVKPIALLQFTMPLFSRARK